MKLLMQFGNIIYLRIDLVGYFTRIQFRVMSLCFFYFVSIFIFIFVLFYYSYMGQ